MANDEVSGGYRYQPGGGYLADRMLVSSLHIDMRDLGSEDEPFRVTDGQAQRLVVGRDGSVDVNGGALHVAADGTVTSHGSGLGGGGASYPGVTPDGLTPGGLTVAGGIQAGGTITSPYVNVSTESSNNGGVNVFAQGGFSGAITGANLGNEGTGIEADSFGDSATSLYAFASGAGSVALYGQAVGAGGVALRLQGLIQLDQAAPYTLGAYSGNAVPIYDPSGTILGWLPLYS